jgi:NifU-like protein involved in Fe-S cluster formation/bacterioferritin-associated ferredoxin
MGNDWVYGDKVKEHFMNPKNVLSTPVEEYDADGIGEVGSPACGDMMMILIKVKDDKIIDLKWKTFGCASAIASTSALSVLVTKNGGMLLEDAYRVTPEQIISELGGLPSNKIHCSVLGDKALREAIDDYYKRNNRTNPLAEGKSKIVCECFGISEEDIRMEVLEGAQDFETLQKRTKIGTACGKCIDEAKSIVEKYVEKYYSDTIYNPEEK